MTADGTIRRAQALIFAFALASCIEPADLGPALENAAGVAGQALSDTSCISAGVAGITTGAVIDGECQDTTVYSFDVGWEPVGPPVTSVWPDPPSNQGDTTVSGVVTAGGCTNNYTTNCREDVREGAYSAWHRECSFPHLAGEDTYTNHDDVDFNIMVVPKKTSIPANVSAAHVAEGKSYYVCTDDFDCPTSYGYACNIANGRCEENTGRAVLGPGNLYGTNSDQPERRTPGALVVELENMYMYPIIDGRNWVFNSFHTDGSQRWNIFDINGNFISVQGDVADWKEKIRSGYGSWYGPEHMPLTQETWQPVDGRCGTGRLDNGVCRMKLGIPFRGDQIAVKGRTVADCGHTRTVVMGGCTSDAGCDVAHGFKCHQYSLGGVCLSSYHLTEIHPATAIAWFHPEPSAPIYVPATNASDEVLASDGTVWIHALSHRPRPGEHHNGGGITLLGEGNALVATFKLAVNTTSENLYIQPIQTDFQVDARCGENWVPAHCQGGQRWYGLPTAGEGWIESYSHPFAHWGKGGLYGGFALPMAETDFMKSGMGNGPLVLVSSDSTKKTYANNLFTITQTRTAANQITVSVYAKRDDTGQMLVNHHSQSTGANRSMPNQITAHFRVCFPKCEGGMNVVGDTCPVACRLFADLSTSQVATPQGCSTLPDSCNDGSYCNGNEYCTSQNGLCGMASSPYPLTTNYRDACARGSANGWRVQTCTELGGGAGQCDDIPCTTDARCNDGVYCNGVETCSVGVCVSTSPPCANGVCNEAEFRCPQCSADADCYATHGGGASCLQGSCQKPAPTFAEGSWQFGSVQFGWDSATTLTAWSPGVGSQVATLNGATTLVANATANDGPYLHLWYANGTTDFRSLNFAPPAGSAAYTQNVGILPQPPGNNSPVTVSAFVYNSSAADNTWNTVVRGDRRFLLAVNSTSGSIRFGVWNQGLGDYDVKETSGLGNVLRKNEWHRIRAVYDGVVVKIFLDEREVYHGPLTNGMWLAGDGARDLLISDNTPPSATWTGKITGVWVAWNEMLYPDDRDARLISTYDMNGAQAADASGPNHTFNLTRNTFTKAPNSSQRVNFYSGAIMGGPAVDATNPMIAYSDKVFSLAATAPGSTYSTQQVTPYASSVLKGLTQITTEAWIKREVDTGALEYVLHSGGGSYISVTIDGGTAGGDKLLCDFRDLVAPLAKPPAISTSKILLNNWYHILCSFDGVTTRVWVNGVNEASANVTTGSGGFYYSANASLSIGSTANAFKGKVTGVKVWDRARDPEVKPHANPECGVASDCVDDMTECNGTPVCTRGTCSQDGLSPCTGSATPTCNETADACVECMTDDACFAQNGYNLGSVCNTTTYTCVPAPLNAALEVNGGKASASSTYAGTSQTKLIDGDRKGLGWPSGGWSDANTAFPDWVRVDFSGAQSISVVDVFTLQDNYGAPADPTFGMTFANYGITNFNVQYCPQGTACADSGTGWLDVGGSPIAGNNRVWRKFTFAAVSATAIRVYITGALNSYSRIVEIEAWNYAPVGVNVALAANGGSGSANAFRSGYVPSLAFDGKRAADAGDTGYWADNTNNTWPDALYSTFNGDKKIGEIDVFTLQDGSGTADATMSMTATQWGLKNFNVQYCQNGTACIAGDPGTGWLDLPGGIGNITNNALVWRRFSLSPPINTNAIRVVGTASNDANQPYANSRIVELEAWQFGGAVPPSAAVGQTTAKGGGLLWSDGTYATSCNTYRVPPAGYNRAVTSAPYTVDPDGSGPIASFVTYCDMVTNGGGWTLIDNDAVTVETIKSRTLGANAHTNVTQGSYLPGYAWSATPQLLCKSSYSFPSGLPSWATFHAVTATARNYPTTPSAVGGISTDWSVAYLNGNTNQGTTHYIYTVANGPINTAWIGGTVDPTCACGWSSGNGTSYSGLGQSQPATTNTCSTWVR